MDLSQFFNVSVAGIPLILVVLGAVTWISRMGITGRGKLLVSMLVGLLLGGCYQVSQNLPATFGEWFAVIVYGVALGLFASGVYDTADMIAAKNQPTTEASELEYRLPEVELEAEAPEGKFLRREKPPVQ